MKSVSLSKNIGNQQGLALLVLVIIIALTFVSYVFSSVSINEIQNQQLKETQVSLKKAKQALINYAVTHMDRGVDDSGEMGFLPCPDINPLLNDEGAQDPGCGALYLNSLGYFPWKTLNGPSLKDSSGSCLLYAVSNTYKLNSSNLLNDDSNGMFQIVDDAGAIKVGALAEDRVVAIVFAPGGPLTGQTRSFTVGSECGMDYDMTVFLEGNGVTNNGILSGMDNDIDQFIHATTTSAQEAPPYNDNFITITHNEIWNAIVARSDFIPKMTALTQTLAECLVEYSKLTVNRRLPWPASMDLNNQNYRVNANYNDQNGALFAGRYPFNVDDSSAAVVTGVVELFGSGGVCASLDDTTEEDRKLWDNWKDHFFYGLSRHYEPNNGGEQECGVGINSCNQIDGVNVAAIVIFSGVKFDAGDLRADVFSGDNDDKANITNYIENGNDAFFAGADGSDPYSTGAPAGNDIRFCIRDKPVGAPGPELDVIAC